MEERKDGRKAGQQDGRKGRPYFKGAFWLSTGVQQKIREFNRNATPIRE